MAKRYWRIRGHNGYETFFDMTVGLGQFTSSQIEDLLKALTAKECLGREEVVGAYAKRGTKISNGLLTVDWDFPTYRCGLDPTFTATVVDEYGKFIPRPKLP